ncbi:hypothetical protein JCM11641_001195 [Rhodosporidiobolus odoratus]
MSPTLPLELQHYILDLALPFMSRDALDERVQPCRIFSLVHLTWTTKGQGELCEYPKFTLRQGKRAQEQIRARLEVAAGKGGIKGIWVVLQDFTLTVRYAIAAIETHCTGIEQMVLEEMDDRFPFQPSAFPHISHVDLARRRSRLWHYEIARLEKLTRRLISLSISGFGL